MGMDQNGIPSVVADNSTVSGTAIGNAVIIPAVTSATFGTLVNDLLATLDDKAVIVVDPNTRKVWARTISASDLTDKVTSEADKVVTLTPDSGQTGKSLTFSKGSTAGVDSTIVAAIDACIGTQKPKRSVQSLVSNLLGQTMPTGRAPLIVIDQVNETVLVADMGAADAGDTWLGQVITTATDQVVLKLTEPANPTSNPLIFEGGATN